MNARKKKITCSQQTRNSFYSILLGAFQAFYTILLNGPPSTPFSQQLPTVKLPPYDPNDKESCSQIALVAAAGGRRGNRRSNTVPAGGKPALGCGAPVRRCDYCELRALRETIRGAGLRSE